MKPQVKSAEYPLPDPGAEDDRYGVVCACAGIPNARAHDNENVIRNSEEFMSVMASIDGTRSYVQDNE